MRLGRKYLFDIIIVSKKYEEYVMVFLRNCHFYTSTASP